MELDAAKSEAASAKKKLNDLQKRFDIESAKSKTLDETVQVSF